MFPIRSNLINFLCSGWIKQAKPFRGDHYDEYSKPKKTSKDWEKAFDLVTKVENGEYEPPPVEEEPEKLTGTKRKRSEKPAKQGGKGKKADGKEPPQKKSRTTKPRTLQKGQNKKVTQVKMSNDVIKSISQKLENCIKDEENDKIETLLDILSKIEISDPTIFKVCFLFFFFFLFHLFKIYTYLNYPKI